jgi:AcrR family transcriptional regulator
MINEQINEQKVDMRIRRTHKLLWEALMALLEDKRLEQITVQDICDRAMVHRTTFYKHYQDKYDLLEQGARSLFEELSTNLAPLSMMLAEVTEGKAPEEVVQVFAHVSENRRFYHETLLGEGIGPFRKLLTTYLVDLMLQRISTREGAREIPDVLIAQYAAGVFITMLTWWLQQGLPYPPRRMAQYVTQFIVYGSSAAFGVNSTVVQQNTARPLKM